MRKEVYKLSTIKEKTFFQNNYENMLRKLLACDFLGQNEAYINFLKSYTSFAFQRAGLEPSRLVYDFSLLFRGVDGYTIYGKDSVFLSRKIFSPPKNMEELVSILGVINHEIGHIKENSQNKVTYKKFDNENGVAYTPTSAILRYITDIFKEDFPLVSDFSNFLYLMSRQEKSARKFAIEKGEALISELEELVSRKESLNTQKARENILVFKKDIEKRRQQEQAYKHKFSPENMRDACRFTCAKIDEVLDGICSGQFQLSELEKRSPFFMFNIISSLNHEGIYSQERFDRFFDFCLNTPLSVKSQDYFYLIANQPENSKSKEMISQFYDAVRLAGGESELDKLTDSILLLSNSEELGINYIADKHFTSELEAQKLLLKLEKGSVLHFEYNEPKFKKLKPKPQPQINPQNGDDSQQVQGEQLNFMGQENMFGR